MGQSTLVSTRWLRLACALGGVPSGPTPYREGGWHDRSDHFEFAKQGVPWRSIPKSGRQFIDKPADYAKQNRMSTPEKNYHKVSASGHAAARWRPHL